MSGRSNPVAPRNGHTLVVGIVARISGCPNQKELSLEDQVDHGKQVVAELYDGPVEYRVDRHQGQRANGSTGPNWPRSRRCSAPASSTCWSSRTSAGSSAAPTAARLCGIAVDHGTRVLAPNDCIDTADASWEEDVISACRDHVGHNAHTSKRLKHKLMNRFVKFGGATPVQIYGYVKPEGAKTYDDWRNDPAAKAIYEEWFRRLRENANCSAVADWLNDQGVPSGPVLPPRDLGRRDGAEGDPQPAAEGDARPRIQAHGQAPRDRPAGLRPEPQGATVYENCPHLTQVDPALWDEVNVSC